MSRLSSEAWWLVYYSRTTHLRVTTSGHAEVFMAEGEVSLGGVGWDETCLVFILVYTTHALLIFVSLLSTSLPERTLAQSRSAALFLDPKSPP